MTASGALHAPAAQAGVFHAYACQRPDGRAIPATDWVMESSRAGLALGQNRCAADGFAALQFGVGEAPTSANDWTGYGLTLPAGLKATLMVMYRWHQMRPPTSGADTGAHPAYDFQFGQSSRFYEAETTITDWCYFQTGCLGYGWPNISTTGSARVAADFPGGASFIGFGLRCRTDTGGTGGSCGGRSDGRALARILGLDVWIRDDTPPVASSPSGSLTEAGPRKGTAALRYDATDVGGGVYIAVLEIDGKEVARYTPGANPSCVDAGSIPDSPYEFDRVQPCDRSTGVAFDVDTTKLSDGTHRATTSVIDAGGNAGNVLSQSFDVANAIPSPSAILPNTGLPAGQLKTKGDKDALRARYGAKKVAITGKLTDVLGRPIAGAKIDVAEQLAVPGAAFAAAGTVTTGSDGTYRVEPKTTATRRLRLTYTGGDGSTSTREVLLTVTAGMSISAKPKVVARRGLITLQGRVRIEGLPATGTWIEVQVQVGKAWRTVGTRRVSTKGTWTFKHRLKSAKNATLSFRSRLRPASDLPSAEAKSAAVRVRVR